MEKTSGASNKQCLEFAGAVNVFFRTIARKYDLPLCSMLKYWGRRDVAIFYFSRELYNWERKMNYEQGNETLLTAFWQRSKIMEDIIAQWNCYLGNHYGITAKKICFFPRQLVGEKEYGYILCIFDSSFFSSACAVNAEQTVSSEFKYIVMKPAGLLTKSKWTEEIINVELCRMLRETGGKGPERCRVMVLDAHHVLFLFFGFIAEGFRGVVAAEPAMVPPLEHMIERNFTTCIQSLLARMEIKCICCDIKLDLEHNEGSALAVL